MCKKFKIMILIDLNRIIFYRKPKEEQILTNRSLDFKIKFYDHFLRPGYKTFLRRLIEHPRGSFFVYTSIINKNLTPILFSILDEKSGLIDLRNKIGLFDQSYCPLMVENERLKDLKEEEWDTYRDLNLVFKSEVC